MCLSSDIKSKVFVPSAYSKVSIKSQIPPALSPIQSSALSTPLKIKYLEEGGIFWNCPDCILIDPHLSILKFAPVPN